MKLKRRRCCGGERKSEATRDVRAECSSRTARGKRGEWRGGAAAAKRAPTESNSYRINRGSEIARTAAKRQHSTHTNRSAHEAHEAVPLPPPPPPTVTKDIRLHISFFFTSGRNEKVVATARSDEACQQI